MFCEFETVENTSIFDTKFGQSELCLIVLSDFDTKIIMLKLTNLLPCQI